MVDHLTIPTPNMPSPRIICLGLTPAKNRKQIGGNKSDNTRDLRDSGSRTSAPKSYRDQFDNFRKDSR